MLKQIKTSLEDVFRAVQTFDDTKLDSDTVRILVREVDGPLACCAGVPRCGSPAAPPPPASL